MDIACKLTILLASCSAFAVQANATKYTKMDAYSCN
jgi:hypothetical protein